MSTVKKDERRTKYDPGIEVDSARVLCLHRNENLFIPVDWMRDFVKSVATEVDATRYPEPNSMRLRCALAEFYAVRPEQVFVGNGSDEVLSDLLGLLRDQYDVLSTLDVHFKVYDMLAERFNFDHQTIPGNTFSTGQIDAHQWNGLALIDSPNAITGCRIAHTSLLRLAEHPESFVIWDNAYGEFAGDRFPGSLPENMMMVRSFSKFFGLAGARVGYCIGSSDIVSQLLARKDSFNVNAFGQNLALNALARVSEFNQFRDAALRCRTKLVNELKKRNFQVLESGGNYVLATHQQYPAKYLQEQLLKREVATRRFSGVPTENYLRFTVPRPEATDRLMVCLDDILTNE